MSRDKQIEEMALTKVDILANDINQHCPDLKENYCGDTHCVACLAHALTAKGYRKASEVAEEIFAEIIEALTGEQIEEARKANSALEAQDTTSYEVYSYAEDKLGTIVLALSLCKKKYIGKDTNVTTNTEGER